jgi:NTE family protein
LPAHAPHFRETGLILPGGGARAAYQIGALRAVAQVLKRDVAQPFPIICGTSAGAINAATLAINADNFRRGVARLIRLWRGIEVGSIYKADLGSVSTHGMQWLADVLVGARGPASAASMLDNTPLLDMLHRTLDFSRLALQIRAGHLRALSVNATSYSSGHAVTFYQGDASIPPWQRMRRRGQRAVLSADHLLASSAIPFIFPAARVDDDFYADGSVRQLTPLSPALHLGARRILVIAVGQFGGQRAVQPASARHYPSFAQVAGHALASIFLDNVGADVERMQTFNRLLELIPEATRRQHSEIVSVESLVLWPSRDLGAMATPYAERLPRGVRYLLRGLGTSEATGGTLLSYLLFDPQYCRDLMALGYSDAIERRGEIEAFLQGNPMPTPPVLPHEIAQ